MSLRSGDSSCGRGCLTFEILVLVVLLSFILFLLLQTRPRLSDKRNGSNGCLQNFNNNSAEKIKTPRKLGQVLTPSPPQRKKSINCFHWGRSCLHWGRSCLHRGRSCLHLAFITKHAAIVKLNIDAQFYLKSSRLPSNTPNALQPTSTPLSRTHRLLSPPQRIQANDSFTNDVCVVFLLSLSQNGHRAKPTESNHQPFTPNKWFPPLGNQGRTKEEKSTL